MMVSLMNNDQMKNKLDEMHDTMLLSVETKVMY